MGGPEGAGGVRGAEQGDLAADRAVQADPAAEGLADPGAVARAAQEGRRLREDAEGAEPGHRDDDREDAEAVLRDAGEVVW